MKQVYTAVPMPRTRVNERERWEQLAAAVLEMRRNLEVLEKRLMVLENPMKADALIDLEYEQVHAES